MSHGDNIIDRDPYFEIDIATRNIVNKSSVKTLVVHNDHNSERFTFSIPRYIEGHDMLECDSITVHYTNTDASTKEKIPGIYDILDFTEDSTTPDNIIGTWLLSQNATSRVGTLEFSIHFECHGENGEIEYSWNTGISKSISVIESLDNTETIYTENVDLLEQWHQESLAIANSTRDELSTQIDALNAKLDAFINGGVTNE